MLLVVKNLPANAGNMRLWFNPWAGKIPWRKAWQPTPVFLPGESPWSEEPGRLQSIEYKELDWSNLACTNTCTHIIKSLCCAPETNKELEHLSLSLGFGINELWEMALTNWVSSSFTCTVEKILPAFQHSYHHMGQRKGPADRWQGFHWMKQNMNKLVSE